MLALGVPGVQGARGRRTCVGRAGVACRARRRHGRWAARAQARGLLESGALERAGPWIARARGSRRASVRGRADGHELAAGRGRAAGRAGGRRADDRQACGLGARAGLGLCTRCTRPVFGPLQLGIFLSQNFWTLFVNPVHEHCSSRNFLKFFFKFNKKSNKIK